MDTNAAAQNGSTTVRLSDSCVENPTTFISILSYGSCPNYVTFQETQIFSSSSTAVFVLNMSGVTGDLCIRVIVAHQSQPDHPLKILEQQLALNSCSIDSINSVASSGVTVEFSLAERSGEVPHGTIATFKALTCGDRLVGAELATCYNGVWNDLSQRTSSCKSSIKIHVVAMVMITTHNIAPLSTSEAVAITFVLSTISTLIVGVISSSFVTYCIMKRQASIEHPPPHQPKGALYEEAQPKTSEQMLEMGDNVAYGQVRH